MRPVLKTAVGPGRRRHERYRMHAGGVAPVVDRIGDGAASSGVDGTRAFVTGRVDERLQPAPACGAVPDEVINTARGLADPARIITHKIDFRDVVGAFGIAESNPHDRWKVLLDFGAEA